MSNIFSVILASAPLDLDAPFQKPDERPPGMRRAVAELAAALAAADADAAPPAPAAAERLRTLAAAVPRTRPADLAPACVSRLIAYMRPKHRPEVAEAARAALSGLMDAAPREPNVQRELGCVAGARAASAVLGDIQAALSAGAGAASAAGGSGSAAAADGGGDADAACAQPAEGLALSRALLVRYLRPLACRPPITAAQKKILLHAGVDMMRPFLGGDKDTAEMPASVQGLSEFESQGALGMLEGAGGITFPPCHPGAAWRFRAERFDGGKVTGAGRAADAIAMEPGAATAAAGLISDLAALLEERTEAVLLLAGLLNALAMIESHFALVQELRSPAAGPAALAAGLERWEREQRADGAAAAGVADPLAAIRSALPKAALGGGPARTAAAAGGAGAEGPAAKACATCGKSEAQAAAAGGKLLRCTGCGKAHYCGKECQDHHWRAGHKAECRAARAGRG